MDKLVRESVLFKLRRYDPKRANLRTIVLFDCIKKNNDLFERLFIKKKRFYLFRQIVVLIFFKNELVCTINVFPK